MSVIDLLAERKSKKAYYASRTVAEDYFFKQKSAIQGIAGTPGYKEIKEYWSRVMEGAFERLKTVKSDDIKGVQATLREADQFLTFLANLENLPK